MPGARVKVRFAGQDVDGYVVERGSGTDHTGQLQPLRRVVSAEPVLAPEIATLSESLAHRYAGARSDVLRLAVPPRHAGAEKLPSEAAPAFVAPEGGAWRAVEHADAFLRRLSEGGDPRAVWSAAPGDDWPLMVAEAVAATYASGRGVLVCVPDRRDVARVDRALTDVLGEGHHVTLTADGGPAARYRDFLAVSRGARRIVVGTRSAAFAPVHDLGLVIVWDDGDDLHAEPRAPYPHTREVLLMRAEQQDTAALVGGVARTPEAQQLVASGWAHELATPRGELRHRARVEAVAAEDRAVGTRIPRAAYDAIRRGLETGPVLVQTPRAGYAPSLACEQCRSPARCRVCTGPLQPRGGRGPAAVPLVRPRRVRLDLRDVWTPRPAGARARRGPDRRGAGPDVPRHDGAQLERRPRRRARRRSCGPRRRHRGGRAGRGRRLCRRADPRHVAHPGARRHAGLRGGAATLAQRGRTRAHRGTRGGRGRPRPPRAAGTGPVGPDRLRPTRVRGACPGPPAAGRPDRHGDR